MATFGIGKSRRLSQRVEITRAFDAGRRRSDAKITLIAARRVGAVRPRFAVLVSRKHGSAVQRNRIKRLCREAWRLTAPELPAAYDYLMLPRVGVELSVAKLQDSIRALTPKD